MKHFPHFNPSLWGGHVLHHRRGRPDRMINDGNARGSRAYARTQKFVCGGRLAHAGIWSSTGGPSNCHKLSACDSMRNFIFLSRGAGIGRKMHRLQLQLIAG